MTQKFEKLKTLLKELFQLDHPDLDFGLYRIMHAKAAEVTQFLERDLLPQVKEEFAKYKTADKAEIEQQLAKAIEQAQSLGADPESLPKVKELRSRLTGDAVDLTALESEVYDHLYSFFRRYYSEGDFLSKRVYKPGVYAIPYEGEEVKLHWANADQYYIKTSEYLRDYTFRLRPDDKVNPRRVHFRLVDATEGEHANVKAVEGKDRVFILVLEDFIAEEDGEHGKELVIRFEYRPATLTDWPDAVREGKKKPPAQKDMTSLAESRVLAVSNTEISNWILELGKPHVKFDGEKADYSRLLAHLNRYVGRNTFDYFIHKDLGTFLRRELDFYIKNEVMHLDDIDSPSQTAPRVEQYLSKIKVIRRIAGKLIVFLSQLEDFQKKLWLKKKFVVETNYCISVSVIPESFFAEIANNDAQREEWVQLQVIDAIEGNGATPGYSNPLNPSFLKSQPTLMIDTKHFEYTFTVRLLDALDGGIDAQTDYILINSENFQALSLLQTRYYKLIDCLYIDPPYNARSSEIAYKNAYKHSSWLSLLEGRIALSQRLLSDAFVHIVAIDENEQERLGLLLQELFASSYHLLVTVIHNHKGIQSQNFSNISEFCYFTFPSNSRKSIAKKKRAEYSLANLNLRDKGNESLRTDARTCFYPFIVRDGVIQGTGDIPAEDFHPAAQTVKTGPNSFEVWPIDVSGVERKWRYAKSSVPAVLAILKAEPGRNGLEINIYKEEENYKTVWSDSEFNAGLHGTRILNSIIPEAPFDFPKSLPLVVESCRAGLNDNKTGVVLDYFAGSGTTAHAIMQLNREDGGKRRGILVEMGQHFDSVLVPRLKKVAFTPEWSEGNPVRSATESEANNSPRIIKYIRLESYEDTLNNLVPTRRNSVQQSLIETREAQGADRLREQYVLTYMLNIETQGSPSLLNVASFTDPTNYLLKVKPPGSDESRELKVDLLETFNWLIGLTVQHIAAPQCFEPKFERDSEKRLQLKGKLKEVDSGKYWFRTVTGATPDGRKTLVIWRKRPGGESPEGVEQDNLVLDEWFTRKEYSSKDSEFDLIYVNGTNNLENLRAPDDTWKVRLIEDDFHRLMFASEGL